ncbi:DUF5994 family protein [Dactylosporangium sp. NPDC000521]|uniref:DUF5994 family protein n=1 Tax=Dactylosporangium sp. NPDC000521 TaxID=3363975 RepID=UPI00369E3FD3
MPSSPFPASQPSAGPRLSLSAVRATRAILDGGWWPRSLDAAAELPDLVVALQERYGRIRRLMLSSAAWDRRFPRLGVDGHEIRIGWFSAVDPEVLIATTDRGDQIDLLVVPPDAPEAVAHGAMVAAADPANRLRAPAVLAAAAAAAHEPLGGGAR